MLDLPLKIFLGIELPQIKIILSYLPLNHLNEKLGY